MRHRLLVVGAVGRHGVALGIERFAEAGDVAVARERKVGMSPFSKLGMSPLD